MRVILAFSAFALALAAGNPPCNMTKNFKETCDDFCNYKCSFHDEGEPEGLQNITIYRITPTNVTGVQNKDTGDPQGDIGFYFTSKMKDADCAKHPEKAGCFLNHHGSELFGAFRIEFDGGYGLYQECNPNRVTVSKGRFPWSKKVGFDDTRNFSCGLGCISPTAEKGCGKPFGGKHNSSAAQKLQCWCDSTNRHLTALGREKFLIPSFVTGVTGGYWYTTPVAGECKKGEPVGTNGCTWRLVETIKYINSTCLNDKIDDAVIKHGHRCFGLCAKPLNKTGKCYNTCYSAVLRTGGMKPEEFVDPFELAFSQDDPAKGGCASLKPAPCQGEQCGPPTAAPVLSLV